MAYQASPGRYAYMEYRRCGNSGLKLPAISLGLWHNFGKQDDYEKCRSILHTAFDCGITHFDLANNYGPPPGAAEETFGRILKQDFLPYRDELIISSKAGWPMWPGPYGDFGSKKYLMASLDQSLKRMGLDYVDIFYHHRPDPETPIEETMVALDQMVRQGKALYVGISSYTAAQTAKAVAVLKELGTPLLIHQPRYSLLDRWVEDGLLDVLEENGVGCITFSSLEQGLLTNKYLQGIPDDSRAASHRGNGALEASGITPELIGKVQSLNEVAGLREQTLAQMSLAWILKDKRITSVIVGASKPEQVLDSVQSLRNYNFGESELQKIEQVLAG
ncbi:L-glyceraldehyde 3-phosphate reductase [Flavisolibacter nicotianae]|uniref:L-glyceraldehyde 3-phosphate reductase n=1 Tax=Flavisolibacter nicotianae TaxID=2364882 RepID=UPI000EAB8AC7|nr:L-glyceraldehyde 3-phosphate reductase [Flavisolibacter nicotianae]